MKLWLPEELYFMRNGRLPQKKCSDSSEGKIVVISGSTSGVGLETLKEFARNKAHIVMVVRNMDKASKIKQEIESQYDLTIDVVIADFSDFKSVEKAAQTIMDTYPKIDILINSVGLYSTKRLYNQDQIELVFTINHLSVFLFTVKLLPLLKKSAPSRIIQVNSEGHRFNGLRVKDINFKKRIYSGLRSYGQSKVAQLFTVYELAKRLQGSGVTINAMHPGAVKTNIGKNNGFLYRFWLGVIVWPFLKDPKVSGESIYYLANSPELKDQSGKFYNLTIEEKPAWHALKMKKSKPIWDLTCAFTKIEDGVDI